MVAQRRNRDCRQRDDAGGITALGFDQLKPALGRVEFLIDPMEGLTNVEPTRVKINIWPCDSETFPQSYAER
jgi:hypothetical protein